jgi:hypothetical protein
MEIHGLSRLLGWEQGTPSEQVRGGASCSLKCGNRESRSLKEMGHRKLGTVSSCICRETGPLAHQAARVSRDRIGQLLLGRIGEGG